MTPENLEQVVFEKGHQICKRPALPSAPSHRHSHTRPQAAGWAVAEADIPAMRTGNIAGDRKPQSGAALILVAGSIKSEKRPEHLFALARRNARPIVVDMDCQKPLILILMEMIILSGLSIITGKSSSNYFMLQYP